MKKTRIALLSLTLLVCFMAANALALTWPLGNSKDMVTISREEYENLLKYEKLELLRQIVET